MSGSVEVIGRNRRNAVSPTVLAVGWAVVASCVVVQGMVEQIVVRGAVVPDFILRWRLFPIVIWGAGIPLVLGATRRWPLPGAGWPVSAAVHAALFSAWMLASNLILRIPEVLYGGVDPVLGEAAVAAVQHAPAGGLAWIALVALERFRERPLRPGGQTGVSRGRPATASGTEVDSPVSLRVGYRTYLVAPDAIRWIEADGDYVRVHTDDRIHRARTTMKELQERLGPSNFVRIHRSTLVNVAFIREVQPYFHGDYMVILRDGTELRVPRSRKRAIRRLKGSSAN